MRMTKPTKESIDKRVLSNKNNRDLKEIQKQKLIKEIKEESRSMLMPNLKAKMKETTDLIVNILKEKDMSNIQIMSLIAKASLLDDVLAGGMSYTPQELRIGFDLYLDMINKINEIKPFPPTIESFANFLGISKATYDNYLVDTERKDVMNFIHSYLLGVLATGGLTGEMKEISSIYLQKTMGRVEQTQPIIVEHKKVANIDDINEKLKLLKPVIDASYEEKK